MLRALSALLFVTVLLPVWAVRRLTGASRFERKFHRRASAWDSPVRQAVTTREPPS